MLRYHMVTLGAYTTHLIIYNNQIFYQINIVIIGIQTQQYNY